MLLAFCLTGPLKAETIPSAYHKIAIEADIPATVLYGVALVESGLKLQSGRVRPWPWTLNVAGVPRRYATRQACYKGLRYYLSHGVRSIDIGIMQVNWHYHRKKLVDPWRALDPVFNVRVGAQILKDEYRKTKAWRKAIGRYHSPGQKPKQKKRAAYYARRVMKHIRRIGKKHLIPPAMKNPPEFQGGFFMVFLEKFGNNALIRQRLAENKSPIA